MQIEFYEFSEDLINLRNELKNIFPYIEGEIFTTFQTNDFCIEITDLNERDVEFTISSHSYSSKILIYSNFEGIHFDGITATDSQLFENLKKIPCCFSFVSKYLDQ